MFRTDFVVQNNPKISIIICNKDQKDTLNKCIDSILNKSTYNNYEIIIVENNSTEGETFQYYNEIQKNAEEKMNTITLQDIINMYYQRTSMQNDLQNII